MNRQYLDPIFCGTYPDEMRQIFGVAWPDVPADDFALIEDRLGLIFSLKRKYGATVEEILAFAEGAAARLSFESFLGGQTSG